MWLAAGTFLRSGGKFDIQRGWINTSKGERSRWKNACFRGSGEYHVLGVTVLCMIRGEKRLGGRVTKSIMHEKKSLLRWTGGGQSR